MTLLRRRWLAATIGALVVVAALPFAGRHLLWRWELNPLLRGRLIAQEAGCFACHRTPSSAGIPNPGSRWGSVPRFSAGNAMMYAPDRATLEEFIRLGAPRAWLEDEASRKRLENQRIRMPAYGERLDEDELADLVAYAAAVEGVELPGDESVSAGRALARKHGCTACHGVEGAGGLVNPGSLGGFIPGFTGGNFTDLVKDRAEFEEWVREGRSARLEANPMVRFFWRRQAISMPAYGDELSDEDIESLWRWVEALRGGG